ncbi:MAG: NrdH-redoxin [Anaerolineae bacterium CG03_land_8_20_14_0_80_58_20]|nr:MAG: NrdH-redoxin [Anaerolineae bacterium CG1_02_58_13]PIV28517.1 MAG: NrdH-redoxin [Anaerolineae bacterium CG03_land_8_20_14_0_80_58_20]
MLNTTPEITAYGADWCPDCRRAKRILDERQAPYRWVDIDRDREGEKFVIQTNRGNRSVPTIVFGDGSILVEPSNAELSAKLYTTRLE